LGGEIVRGKADLLLPVVAALLLLPGACLEAAKSSAKPPKPGKALLMAAKKLMKTKNYRAKVTIEGGVSEREDHKITQRSVGETYEGEVYARLGRVGPVMHVPQARAYRLPKKGVAYIQGAWRNILSEPKNVCMDRLFMFPEIVLGRAVRLSRAAKWLDAPKKEDSEGSKAEKEESGRKKSTGPTVVLKDTSEEEAMAAWPRIVRIDAPPKEALKYFLEAQNSGCMSAG